MNDTSSDAVRERLQNLGFSVNHIPEEHGEKRPDLLAEKDGVRMYVEVKTREVDNAYRSKLEAVPCGATQKVLTPLNKHNSLSSDIKHASKQLEAVSLPDDFRLLWYRAHNKLFVQGMTAQLCATLLGVRMLAVMSDGKKRLGACMYAGQADFYRFKAIDGAILEEDDGNIVLFLNAFSPRADAFKHSHLALQVADSIVSEAFAQDREDWFILSGDAPRSDDEAILRRLCKFYPDTEFVEFVEYNAGTIMTTIDGSLRRDA